jgi:hypothetical protein
MISLNHVAPGIGLAASVDDFTSAPSYSKPVAVASRVFSYVYSMNAIATTGGTTPVGAVVTLASLLSTLSEFLLWHELQGSPTPASIAKSTTISVSRNQVETERGNF